MNSGHKKAQRDGWALPNDLCFCERLFGFQLFEAVKPHTGKEYTPNRPDDSSSFGEPVIDNRLYPQLS
jgi:hypothetical protein